MITAPLILDHRGNPISAQAVFSHFEGASTETRFGEWGLSGAGPNASVTPSIGSLRKRARTLCNNNPLAKGGIDSFVSNLVGTDISPTWELDNSAQKEELQRLWADSQQELDYYGYSDFYGQEEVAARATVQDGEMLGRFRAALKSQLQRVFEGPELERIRAMPISEMQALARGGYRGMRSADEFGKLKN